MLYGYKPISLCLYLKGKWNNCQVAKIYNFEEKIGIRKSHNDSEKLFVMGFFDKDFKQCQLRCFL